VRTEPEGVNDSHGQIVAEGRNRISHVAPRAPGCRAGCSRREGQVLGERETHGVATSGHASLDTYPTSSHFLLTCLASSSAPRRVPTVASLCFPPTGTRRRLPSRDHPSQPPRTSTVALRPAAPAQPVRVRPVLRANTFTRFPQSFSFAAVDARPPQGTGWAKRADRGDGELALEAQTRGTRDVGSRGGTRKPTPPVLFAMH